VIKFCQCLAIGRWFSPGTLVSSTNKTDHYDIAEILFKVALNTIKPNQTIFLSVTTEPKKRNISLIGLIRILVQIHNPTWLPEQITEFDW
jgi:hypothetical protein